MKTRLRQTELQMQYAQLAQPGNCPEGVYVSPSDHLDRWNGVIFVRRGYYQGSILGFEISFPSTYPYRVPTVHFAKGSIVHPLVNPKDDRLALSSAFPSWSAQTDNVTKLLFFIKSIFKTYTLDKLTDGLVSNGEAWRLYRSNRPTFAKLAGQCATVSSSSSSLYGRSSTGAGAEGGNEHQQQLQQQHRLPGIAFRELSESDTKDLREFIFGE